MKRKKKDISFLVCSNGYGHFKRCLQVAEYISPQFNINFICKDSLINFARNEANFGNPTSINFISKYSFNEFSWIDENQITWERYMAWKQTLESSTELINSHLVVSDNHMLPGSLFSNVIFMGSFLWHDSTVSTNKQVIEIKEHEKFILSTKAFSLLCVGDMVMPSLSDQVCLLKQGWFTSRIEIAKRSSSIKKVLITGGGTELTNNKLLELILQLHKLNSRPFFYLDNKLYALASKYSTDFKLFNFTEEEFISLDIIVGRPGIGILTDCVRYSIPCIVLNDSFNLEIKHNTIRVNELGIGRGLDIKDSGVFELANTITDLIYDADFLSYCFDNLKNRPVNGAFSSAQHILKILENE